MKPMKKLLLSRRGYKKRCKKGNEDEEEVKQQDRRAKHKVEIE